MKQVFSNGGGTQGTAIAVLIILGRLPKPDFAVIADTERELRTTWDYMDEFVKPGLASVGVEYRRVKASDYAYTANLHNAKGTMLMPAFTNYGGETSKLPNFCTTYWKIDAISNYLSREHGLTESQYVKWIGFSLDEGRRVQKMMNGAPYQAGRVRFPLIHDVPLRREQAKAIVRSFGWPNPPRSRCYDCPNQTDYEWIDTKRNSPSEFQASVLEERAARAKDPSIFFHKSLIPLEEVKFDVTPDLFANPGCDSGECFL